MNIFGGGDKEAKRQAAEARAREAQRVANINAGKEAIDRAFGGFDDNYYQGRSNSYLDYATPQLEKQFTDAKKALTYALSRGGKLNSTTAGEKQRELLDFYERGRTDLNSTATNFANQARKDVSNSRTNLLQLLNATEDPAAARDEAIRNAAVLNTQPSFDPLGNVFAQFSAGLEKLGNSPATGYGGFFGKSLFQDSAGGRGSGRVVA